MSGPSICEGCGRPAAAREVFCPACGRALPGREQPAAASDAAPPGWLVAADARGESGVFEPLPPVPVSLPEWRVRTRGLDDHEATTAAVESGVQSAPRRTLPADRPQLLPPAPVAPPPSRVAVPADAVLGTAPSVPPLHVLQLPLLVLAALSTAGAVTLLLLHVLLHR